MPLERIAAPDDPRVAEYRDVAEPELVRVRGLFVAEGRLVVRRVIEDGRYDVRSVLLSEAAHRALAPSLARLPGHVPVYLVEARDFLGITGIDIHRGCLALVARPPASDLDSLLAASQRLVVLDGVTNADNVGGVFRTSAAFGVDVLLLSPTTCDPFYRKAIRTSMGAVLRVPFVRVHDWPSALERVRGAGFSLLALTPRPPSEDLAAVCSTRRPAKFALLVGAEGEGLSADASRAADRRLRIAIEADIDSLNLVVATGIALYALGADFT